MNHHDINVPFSTSPIQDPTFAKWLQELTDRPGDTYGLLLELLKVVIYQQARQESESSLLAMVSNMAPNLHGTPIGPVDDEPADRAKCRLLVEITQPTVGAAFHANNMKSQLTPRQIRVLQTILDNPDHSYDAHAQSLAIARSTFCKHLAQIFRLFEVTNITAAIIRAIELGLVKVVRST